MEKKAQEIIKKRSIAKRKREKAKNNREKYLNGICPSCGSTHVMIWKRGANIYDCEVCR